MLGQAGAPVVAAMHWWTSRGPRASDKRSQVRQLLARSLQAWGRQVRQIFDRDVASGPWHTVLLAAQLGFVLRWKKGQKLLDGWGEERKAWQITRGKRSWAYRWLRDYQTGEVHKVGVVAVCVTHPMQPTAAVGGAGAARRASRAAVFADQRPDCSVEDAWAVVFAYARRWQIEWTWR